MKQTIFKSVTALLCVIALCVTSVVAIGKYTDAMVDVAQYAPASSSQQNSSSVSTDNSTDDSAISTDDASADATDDGTLTDDTAADADATATDATSSSDSSAAASSSSSSSTTAASNSSTSSTSTDPTKYTKDQIVTYYNNAIKNTAKAAKLTVTKTENISITVDSMKPDSSALQKIINENVLTKYAKPTTTTKSFTNGVATDKTTATDFLPKSQLQSAGAKSATITKSGSNYVVTIVTVAEKSTLENPKPTYATQCAAPLDLASVSLGPIKITQADMNYPGITLKATVNANGTLVSSSINQPLNGTGTASVIGLKPSATVSGEWTQSNTYKYS